MGEGVGGDEIRRSKSKQGRRRKREEKKGMIDGNVSREERKTAEESGKRQRHSLCLESDTRWPAVSEHSCEAASQIET